MPGPWVSRTPRARRRGGWLAGWLATVSALEERSTRHHSGSGSCITSASIRPDE